MTARLTVADANADFAAAVDLLDELFALDDDCFEELAIEIVRDWRWFRVGGPRTWVSPLARFADVPASWIYDILAHYVAPSVSPDWKDAYNGPRRLVDLIAEVPLGISVRDYRARKSYLHSAYDDPNIWPTESFA